MRGAYVLGVVVLAVGSPWGCAKPDPLLACRDVGPTGFRAEAPACTTDRCRACAAALDAAWRDPADPAARTRFRARFMSTAADARDAFASRVRPDGTYPYEHCTASTAPDARCAGASPYCLDVLAEGLRSGDTSLAQRTQYNLAASRLCPIPRDALVTRLARCEPVAPDDRCDRGPCATCMAGHLAALSVLSPVADQEPGASAMRAVVEATPEVVARAITEALGAPDAPADLETVVVQRSLRAYCFALVARSAAPPPYACNAVMTRFLTHAEYPDAVKAWDALAQARGPVREPVLDALLVEVTRAEAPPAETLSRLEALPAEGTVAPITRAMASPVATTGAYAALRGVLVRRGVTGPALPPVNRPSAPAPTPSAPSTETGRPANGAVRVPRMSPARSG